MTIPILIDKQDTFEIVRDQIAQILADEVASQMALATTAGKDPELWHISIFTERSNPFERYLNDDPDTTPIANIWFDSATFQERASTVIERQQTEGTFNIDCYGVGFSKATAEGHDPGDRQAAFECQRVLRLVRNIIMAAEYTYLLQQGMVGRRWAQAITLFQPTQDSIAIQNVMGARLSIRVLYNEYSPQVEAVELEKVAVDIRRDEDDQVLAQVEYDYPLTP